MSSRSKRTTQPLATSSANKANKATASSSATVSDKRHVTNLDEELSSLFRTDLVLVRTSHVPGETRVAPWRWHLRSGMVARGRPAEAT